MKQVEVTTKNKTPQELELVPLVEYIVEKFSVPLFTRKILIEYNSRPHSHPVLTLDTKTKDPLVILKTIVHEQFHWWAQEHPRYSDCIAYLKTKYQDNGEHNKSGTYPNSFWEHIIVCFNTRKALWSLAKADEFYYIYNQWQAYPLTEKMIEENFEHIKKELEQFDMVYVGHRP